MKDRTIIIGDIHGAFRALIQVLQRAEYLPRRDTLICIGDYIDGHSESFEVCEYLLNLRMANRLDDFKDVILLKGNHDDMFHEVLKYHFHALPEKDTVRHKYFNWWNQGGESTYRSFMNHPLDHILHLKEHFFDKLKLYHLEDNILYVHGGFDYKRGLEDCERFNPNDFFWDRKLWQRATHLQYLMDRSSSKPKEETWKLGGFDRIYIGHTQTTDNDYHEPMLEPKSQCNVMNIDQGCGYKGRLTAYIHESDTFVQSDPVHELYPGTVYSFEKKHRR